MCARCVHVCEREKVSEGERMRDCVALESMNERARETDTNRQRRRKFEKCHTVMPEHQFLHSSNSHQDKLYVRLAAVDDQVIF